MTWSFFPNICHWSTFYLELWPFIGLHLVWRMWAISQPDFKKVEKRIRVQSWRVVWSESFLSFFVFRNHEEYGKLIKSIVIFLGTKGLIIIYFSLFYPVEVCSTGKDILWNISLPAGDKTSFVFQEKKWHLHKTSGCRKLVIRLWYARRAVIFFSPSSLVKAAAAEAFSPVHIIV